MFKVNKKHLIFIILVFFIFAHKASADLEITEVMYDPEGSDTNREWIKLYNNGNDTITIISGKSNSAWRFSSDIEGKELHLINDQLVINPESFAILASNKETFISENTEFNGPVADTSMSLNNISGVVRIWDGSNPRRVIASKEYNSNISGENSKDDSSTTDSGTSTSSQSSSSNSSSTKSDTKIYKITTKIISPKIVVAGIPFLINHQTTGTKNEKVIIGKFIWNFGDGMMRQSSTSDQFSYAYQYPGDYVLTLSFYDSILGTSPDATDRINIKVIPSGLNITSVGNSSDPFVEIENNSSYEMSINNFVIKGNIHSFIIPEGMVILPNKKVKLSSKITGFDFNDLSHITISDSAGLVFATYPKKNYSSSGMYSSNKNLDKGIVKSDTDNKLEREQEIINLNDLGANVVESNGLNNVSNSYYAWSGLIFVIVVGVASVILIRRKKYYPDYVDDEINAKDMTIIE